MKKSRPRRRPRRRHSTDHFFRKEAGKESPFFEVGAMRAVSRGSALSLNGKGRPGKAVNFGSGQGVQLRGLTSADYANNGWSLINENLARGSGCEGCNDRQCEQYSATVRSTFQVATNVSLPNMSEYSHMSECQQQRIRNAINNVLAPHEQQHVAAFRTYNGTVETPIALTACRNQLATLVRSRADSTHLSVERPRRASAQGASDALDPFVVNVDLNCTD